MTWLRGAGGVADAEWTSFEATLGLSAVYAQQAGLIADMDAVGDAIYGRPAQSDRQAA